MKIVYIFFDMNLKAEEQILLKDIFAATVNPNDHSGTYLPQFASLLSKLGPNTSLLVHSSYFDSMIMEQLKVPGRNILDYLQDCWNRAEVAQGKSWNNSNQSQEFIKYSIEIIKNFVFLSLQEHQLFPDQLLIDPNIQHASDKNQQIAMKILSHIQQRGYNEQLFKIIVDGIGSQFYDSFLHVLLARQRFQTILDPKSFVYLSLLVDLFAQNQFRERFISLKELGGLIDQSYFGIFLRLSILGQSPGNYYQENQSVMRFEQRVIKQLGNDHLSKEKMKFYTNLQNEFYTKLTEAYKMLLKKSTQKQFLEWNYKLLLSNTGKMKLGARLHNANNANLSHDGILINAYACFLNLCKVIIARTDDKYKSIDPTYFRDHQKAIKMKYDPINSKSIKKVDNKKDYGTITQFFFLCLQFLHMGVCGAYQNFTQFNQMKKNYEKQLSRMPQNHHLRKKVQFQIQKLQSQIVRYYVLLFQDDTTINTTLKFLDLLLEVLPEWLGYSYNQYDGTIINEKQSYLAHFLPELLITIFSKYHTAFFSYKQNYLSSLGQQHLEKLLNFICYLLSEQQTVSNPYVAASYVQLIYLFLHDSKAGIMHEVFKDSKVALKNLTYGLIRFYCSIAITGRSSAFYQKFKYRFYTNKIFTTLWAHQPYRKNLKNYFHTPIFEKFLNMILTDTTYCFDQTNQNYQQFKKLQAKKAEGPLSAEDLKNEEMVERVIGSTLSQSSSNLKLMRDLSVWSPQTFLTQADRSTAVPLLNNILKTFVDPGAFTSNRQLVTKFKFQSAPALADLVQIYANLDINEILSSQIVKDGRNYKKEYFSKGLQKASNEHYTSIDILQKFQGLIEKLSNAQNEQEQDEQIYGEIPDRYLCQLMITLMKDPVLLPGSGNIVDRVAIHRSLLSVEQDPFTRQPLKESDLIPQKELKEQIEVWKKKRLEQLKKGGKEVKYGKIAANRKEESEQVLKNNNLVIQQQ